MKKFRKVYVEITNICNMHCSFCPETNRAKAFMHVKDFDKIAKQIEPYTDYIYLHVKGEPLLHPQFKEILDICNKYNLKINISTNATLLGEKENVIKGANIRQLNISLHSFEQDENSQKLQKYLENVTRVCNSLADNNTVIRYKLWNNKNEKCEKNNKYILEYLDNMYNSYILNSSYDKDIKLRNNVYISVKQPFMWPDIKYEQDTNGTCYGLRKQIAILVDGTVVPCCVDNNGDINLGNIFNKLLEQILNSQRAEIIKKGFEDNKCVETLCRKCTYKNQCNKNVT